MWGVWIWWSRCRILIQPRAYAEWKVLPKKKGRPANFSTLNMICLDCRCFFYAFYSYRKSIAVVCKFGGSVKRLPIMGFSCKFLSDKSCSIFFLVSPFSLQCWGRALFFSFHCHENEYFILRCVYGYWSCYLSCKVLNRDIISDL